MTWVKLPQTDRYQLTRANVPLSLLEVDVQSQAQLAPQASAEGLVLVNITIADGQITDISPVSDGAFACGSVEVANSGQTGSAIDLKGGQVWPTFVDLHTHLDKGHIWPRTPNPDGSFPAALQAARGDRDRYWHAEDLYRRMQFGLQCSYAHGTAAIRTHLDSFEPPGSTSWKVFRQLREEWRDRICLQAVSLVPLDYYFTPAGEVLVDCVAESGGILGGLPLMGVDLEHHCDRFFAIAKDRQLDVDLHVDESSNPGDITLQYVARAAISHQFEGRIVCGHCCSLAVQSPDVVRETVALVTAANIAVVSLPQCNLYLQDRAQVASPPPYQQEEPSVFPPRTGLTPRWRGVTLLHELRQAGIPVAVASDNCRDPFHSFGDHDMLDVFTWAVRVAHLDRPYGNWPQVVSRTSADIMGLPQMGRIGVGYPADLVLFRGRSFSELLSRSQHDRLVLRRGRAIEPHLPPYEDLDDLVLEGLR